MSITSLKDTQFSILELASVRDDKSIQFTLQHALQLAQHAEQLGYRRFWLAEHHNMDGIASSATAVMIGYIAANTQSLRLSSGGIMLLWLLQSSLEPWQRFIQTELNSDLAALPVPTK